MSDTGESAVSTLILAAPDFQIEQSEPREKPRLLVDHANPHETVRELAAVFVQRSDLFDRGFLARLVEDEINGGLSARQVTADHLVMVAHELCRPYIIRTDKNGSVTEVDCRLPRSIAVMYGDMVAGWNLPLLKGIASTPILFGDGTILSAPGYNAATGIWLDKPPSIADLVPAQPTLEMAQAALKQIREAFKTFCFADAKTVASAHTRVVDTSADPGADESAFLAALLTSVCRPSLDLAPGYIIKAASVSGAGTGKGLLARAICAIAFGSRPSAVTSGGSTKELEKRIVAALMEGGPELFIDNLNNTAVKSDLLASVLTERPTKSRVLGQSVMRPLSASSFVMITGNGLSVTEDLARRFITTELDAKSENPEARVFPSNVLTQVTSKRLELLSQILTIWRWGRVNATLPHGRPMGSFETWGNWVRDPLLALGCVDPAERVLEAKSRDVGRLHTGEIFEVWSQCHGSEPVTAFDLHENVKRALDPHDRGRQFQVAELNKLVGTRMHGHVLTRQPAPGKWGKATFALIPTASE